MQFFLAPSLAFARWVTHYPTGFVVVVRSRPGGASQCLHEARCVDLLAADVPSAAPPVRAWACAADRDELEAWADWEGYSLIYCRTCGAELAKFGPPLEWPAPAALGRSPALPLDPGGRDVTAAALMLKGWVRSEEVVGADS